MRTIPASEWDYRTIKELVEALQARKISASELVGHTIARIEAEDIYWTFAKNLLVYTMNFVGRESRVSGRRFMYC